MAARRTSFSEAVDNITEDFRVVKGNNLQSDSRRESVKAKVNTWEDTGEHKGRRNTRIN